MLLKYFENRVHFDISVLNHIEVEFVHHLNVGFISHSPACAPSQPNLRKQTCRPEASIAAHQQK
jgi:hypothetical protein